ncbi:hypothetical protein ABWH93_20920 [Seohaeicola saemankumensis]
MAQSATPKPQAAPQPTPAPVTASSGAATGRDPVFTDFASI